MSEVSVYGRLTLLLQACDKAERHVVSRQQGKVSHLDTDVAERREIMV